MSPNVVAMETSANCTGSSASGMALQNCLKVRGLDLFIPSSANQRPGLSLGEDIPWVKAISSEGGSSELSAAGIGWPQRVGAQGIVSMTDHPLSCLDSLASHSKVAPSHGFFRIVDCFLGKLTREELVRQTTAPYTHLISILCYSICPFSFLPLASISAGLSGWFGGMTQTLIPEASDLLVTMFFSSLGCCTCPFIIKTEYENTSKCPGGCQTYSFLASLNTNSCGSH